MPNCGKVYVDDHECEFSEPAIQEEYSISPPEESAKVIGPGPLKLKVSVPLFGRSESVIMVDTDAQDTPSVRLVIQIEGDGEPVPRIVMQTQNLELRGTAAGQTIRGELEIQSVEQPGSAPWVSRLLSSSSMVQVTRRDPVSEERVAEDIVFATPQGKISRILVTAQGLGLVDFALIPHLDHEDHSDASLANAEKWAARIPVPTYAIDDQTAMKVAGGTVEVVSEGHWKLFTP